MLVFSKLIYCFCEFQAQLYSVDLFYSSSTNSLNSTTLSHQSNNNEEITVEINGANTTPTINTNEDILEIVSGLILD